MRCENAVNTVSASTCSIISNLAVFIGYKSEGNEDQWL